MINRYRPLLFLLFVGTFFITASSVLFYAYGYRFSFERGIFIYTGSVSLKTNVKTVSIKIDNVAIPEKSLGLLNKSIHIAGLNPGEHMVEVSAPGFRPWTKKAVIQSGLTTEFWNIALSQETYERTAVLATENVIKMFPAPNGLFATVKKNDARYSVDILDIGAKKNEEVFSTDEATFSPTLETNIEWSPESHKLIIPLTKNNQLIYAILDIKTKEVFYLNDAAHITTPLRVPRWDATAKNFLFFLSADTLYRFDTNHPDTAATPIKEHVAGYDISSRNLYYINSENGIVYRINGSGQDAVPEQITPTPIALDTNDTYSLVVYDNSRLTIITEGTGTLFVYNQEVADTPLKELGRDVKSIQYSDDGKKLLFYTDNEMSVYFNQDWSAQPARAKESITQIGRFSAPIKNVQWAEDYEHIIFSLDKSVKMIELDNRDRRDLSDLLTLDTPPTQILSRFGTDTLYIVQEQTTETPGNTSVFSIALPQYANLFGL